MPATLPVPKWLTQAAKHYSDMLGLCGFKVTLYVVPCPDDNAGARAVCITHADLNEATIEFRADIRDSRDWRIVVIHELIHIAHGRIDGCFEDVILPQLKGKSREMAGRAYTQQYESFTHRLATALYEWDQQKRR